jgi:hypothetical protein
MAGCNTSAAVIEGILEEQGTTGGAPQHAARDRQYRQRERRRELTISAGGVPLYFASCFIILICI